ncbi:MAG: hypothetical protein K8R60_01485 [Burkholderiales bacterium]|nr:hypothetical protein [Burkholderiales bacterium]
MHSESLTFTLRLVETHEDLMRACSVRAEAYGHKIPAFRESMAHPDHIDASPWTSIFLCEDKDTGNAVGTMRIQATTRGASMLEIEKYVTPPPELLQQGRAEVTRLASVRGSDPFVRLAMWKACYLYCIAIQARLLIMGVRKPALLRAYERMGAKDIFGDRHEVPLGHAGNLPHRVLALDIGTCEQEWREGYPDLWHFFFATLHPDISVVPLVHRQPIEKVRLHVVQ